MWRNILQIHPAASERNPRGFLLESFNIYKPLERPYKRMKSRHNTPLIFGVLDYHLAPITGTTQKWHQNITHPPLEKWWCFGWCWKPLAEGDDKGRIVSLSLFFRLEVLQDLMHLRMSQRLLATISLRERHPKHVWFWFQTDLEVNWKTQILKGKASDTNNPHNPNLPNSIPSITRPEFSSEWQTSSTILHHFHLTFSKPLPL